MEADKVTWEQQLERQATLLDSRAAKVQRLEGEGPPAQGCVLLLHV